MATELIVPALGESITEVQIGSWLKSEGEDVRRDDPVVELESDKATVELPAPASGKISRLLKKTGETAAIGEVIGYIEADGAGSVAAVKQVSKKKSKEPVAPPPASREEAAPKETPRRSEPAVSPAARRVLAEKGLSTAEVSASGKGGRLLKEDVLKFAEPASAEPAAEPSPTTPAPEIREEEIVPMTSIRRRIAQRLVEAQQTAALLTTFNEIDMTAVIALRREYQEQFQERYQIKVGFMSFFVKATIEALKEVPALNAEIRGEDIVYRNYYDIGIAVGSGKGLVVPVLRGAERLSFAEIEQAIADFARRAKENKLQIGELQGGTFTISNGGIYGSLLSTPIVNPPQSGVLGMHAIQDRPVARSGQVVIRPMMYVALTYDHRLVDGREAVTFLLRIKEIIEDPPRMLLEI
ncbi:MAG: 2-oxoglutarate dehydrogenase complex dihydrolipoyllysine-residue succinyltransferase [Candidatus Hydrogenedentes bacterium]|nr:2-oxoglutarate dehydrogenase complex dihydrolipoyllysine-residue succinyltransferase [Candidatus Hydrogenedentota bacterium]